ncbi:MAG: glycosyltransferase, partial [Oscillospiraceae bacterium]|nr:glycosyltransferase [Oscillospiraceae bacterium]
PGWTEHARRLEEHWRSAVREGDTVVLPGDISWAMNLTQALPDFQFLHRLPGRKVILKGNHDYWWNTRKKIEDFWAAHGLDSLALLHNNAVVAEGVALCGSRGWFFDSEEAGDQKVLLREAERLRSSIRAGKKLSDRIAVFLHYPPIANGRVCEEIFQVLLEEGVRCCYYGHLHAEARRWAFQGERGGIRFRLISGDQLDFRPLRIAPEDILPLHRRISLILPFYNEQEFLPRAVDSVLAQTVQDWELILVDDGSRDASAALAQQLARRDPRIRLVQHAENRGLSAARNTGMEHANGEYLAFLDADDLLEPPFFQAMLEAAHTESAHADVVHAPLLYLPLGASDPLPPAPQTHPDGWVLQKPEFLSLLTHMQENQFFLYAVRCIYRRAFLREQRLRFAQEIRFGEDSIFLMDVFAHAGRAVLISRAHYIYTARAQSMTASFWKRPDAPELFDAHHAAKLERLCRYLDEPSVRREGLRSYAEHIRKVFLPWALRGARERLGKSDRRAEKAIFRTEFARFALQNSDVSRSLSLRAMDSLACWLAKQHCYFAAHLVCRYLWFRG